MLALEYKNLKPTWIIKSKIPQQWLHLAHEKLACPYSHFLNSNTFGDLGRLLLKLQNKNMHFWYSKNVSAF